MSVIIPDSRFEMPSLLEGRKPTGAVKIDLEDELSEQLRFYMLCNQDPNINTNQNMVEGSDWEADIISTDLTSYKEGLAIDLAPTSATDTASGVWVNAFGTVEGAPKLLLEDQWTMCLVGKIGQTWDADGRMTFIDTRPASGGVGLLLNLEDSGEKSINFELVDSSGSYYRVFTRVPNVWSVGDTFTLVLSCNNITGQYCFRFNKQTEEGILPISIQIEPNQIGIPIFKMGRRTSTSLDSFVGGAFLVAFYDKALSKQQVKKLHQNPCRVLVPK